MRAPEIPPVVATYPRTSRSGVQGKRYPDNLPVGVQGILEDIGVPPLVGLQRSDRSLMTSGNPDSRMTGKEQLGVAS